MTKEKINQDILEDYPEKKQVDAFPERRYIRLARFLTIFTVINLAITIACSGIYFYLAKNKDITLNNRGWVHMYSIDPEKKLLLPSEPFQTNVSAMQLMIEKALRQYLEERYAFIWDLDAMRKRWGDDGYVAHLSSSNVFSQFHTEVSNSWNNLQRRRIVRDVHIYSLYPVHGDLWSAYIETFDFSLNENLEKNCDCSDNSYECIACKEDDMIPDSRQRKKILLRVNFKGRKNCTKEEEEQTNSKGGQKICDNPLGIMVYAFYPAYVPVPQKGDKKKEIYWDLPPALRPRI